MPGPIKIIKKLLSKLSKSNKATGYKTSSQYRKPNDPYNLSRIGAKSNPEFQNLLKNSRRPGFSASDISVKLNKNYPHKGSLDANFQDWVKKHGLTKPKLGEGGAVGPNGIL